MDIIWIELLRLIKVVHSGLATIRLYFLSVTRSSFLGNVQWSLDNIMFIVVLVFLALQAVCWNLFFYLHFTTNVTFNSFLQNCYGRRVSLLNFAHSCEKLFSLQCCNPILSLKRSHFLGHPLCKICSASH